MKYLNRFNESNSSIIDRDYMSECFINIIDNYDAEVGVCKSESDAYDDELDEWSISINLPHISYNTTQHKWSIIKFDNDIIENTIIKSKKLIELYEEIKSSIDRVKINYANIEVEYYTEGEPFKNDNDTEYNLEDAYIFINFKK